MTVPSADPVIKQYREQISDNDLKIMEALNKRVNLVRILKHYKESRGLSFCDAAREDWVVTFLVPCQPRSHVECKPERKPCACPQGGQA